MKIVGGVVYGTPRTAFLPSLLLRHGTAVRCSSSSSTSEHISFIEDVAATQPPQHLCQLLKMLKTRGETIISPGAKKGIIPIAIPLAKNSSGTVTALLRWPTAPPGMEMPVVDVNKNGVWLLSKSVDQLIHRFLVEEDVIDGRGKSDELFQSSAEAGLNFYKRGDFAKSQISSLDVYLLKKVGLFPDVLEGKVMRHFEEGDFVSALVTGEFYTKKEHFPGFGRPFVFNAEVLLKVGRKTEAKDAARGALKSPWWTLGCNYHDVASIAQWEDEQIEYIKEKVTEEGKQEDLKKGKAVEQIALDEAAYLLDLASIDASWEESVERIGSCYEQAGLPEMARFKFYENVLVTTLVSPTEQTSHELRLSSCGQNKSQLLRKNPRDLRLHFFMHIRNWIFRSWEVLQFWCSSPYYIINIREDKNHRPLASEKNNDESNFEAEKPQCISALYSFLYKALGDAIGLSAGDKLHEDLNDQYNLDVAA